MLTHVLTDDVADGGALVVLEVEAPGAGVAGGLLHLLLAKAGLRLSVVFQVVKEPVLDLCELTHCTVIENHGADRLAVHCSFVVSLDVSDHIQLSL